MAARHTVSDRLRTQWLGRSLCWLDEVTSTNDEARAAAKAGLPTGHVVVADRQTAGRGTHGRSWSSEVGKDLTFSCVIRPQNPPHASESAATLSNETPLSLVVGLAVATAVEYATGTSAEVKWPNDVLLRRRKCAGILVETRVVGSELKDAIVGIGLNVNRQVFHPSLNATSLSVETGKSFDRLALFADLLLKLEHAFDRIQQGPGSSWLGDIEERLAFRDEEVWCDDLQGRVLGLQADGALRFAIHGKEQPIYAGRLSPTKPG